MHEPAWVISVPCDRAAGKSMARSQAFVEAKACRRGGRLPSKPFANKPNRLHNDVNKSINRHSGLT
jgi:hypothetical protein